jgi:hypothetical protein
MLGLGVSFGWASIYLIPMAVDLGMRPDVASGIPYIAFGVGLLFGASVVLLRTAAALAMHLAAILLVGLVFAFFGLLFGGGLVSFGFSETVAERMPLYGFAFGALLGSAPLVARAVAFVRRRDRGGDGSRTIRP